MTIRRWVAWGISAAGVLAVVWWAASITLPRYFVAQAQARGTWGDMTAPEAVAATTLRQAAVQYHVYMSPGYLDTPAHSYLAADTPVDPWPGMPALPFPSANGRDVLLILDPPLAGDLSYIAHLYPHATVDPLRTPSGEGPLMFTIRIPATDIQAPHGVRAGLLDPGAIIPREERTLPGMLFDWGGAGGRAGTLRLAATLRVDLYGAYAFNWQPAGPATASNLLVDGYPVTPGQTLPLAVGLHSIVATDTVATATGVAQLRWIPPGGAAEAIPPADLFDPQRIEPHGLTGLYRVGTEASGAVQTASVDAVISFFFHRPGLPTGRPYNVEWLGRLYVPEAGTYQLGTEQISSSELTVDGKEVIANTQPNALHEAPLTLAAGWHDLRLHYVDAEFYSHIYLYWTPPGRPHSIIPAAFLWPQMGQYPSVPASGAWPTLAESDGSVLPGGPAGSPAAGPTPAAPPGGGATPPAQGANPTPPAPAPGGSPGPAGAALAPRLVLGAPGGTLGQPRGAATDAQGNLYVYTGQDSKISKFSTAGAPISGWDVRDKDGNPLIEGSALLLQGNQLWVLDAASNDLLGYDLAGKPAGRIHLCECFSPRGVALARDGNFWVADTGHNQVLKVSPAGQTLVMLGGPGPAPGQFAEPASVWETAQGTLYVADISNSRVQSFGPTGQPLAAWPVGASIARDGNRLAGDSAGNVLVTEAASGAVVRYDPHGAEGGRWTYAPGGAVLLPAGIAPAGGDLFVVLYLSNGLAAVFAPGK